MGAEVLPAPPHLRQVVIGRAQVDRHGQLHGGNFQDAYYLVLDAVGSQVGGGSSQASDQKRRIAFLRKAGGYALARAASSSGYCCRLPFFEEALHGLIRVGLQPVPCNHRPQHDAGARHGQQYRQYKGVLRMAHPPSYQKVSTTDYRHRAKADTQAGEVMPRPGRCRRLFLRRQMLPVRGV